MATATGRADTASIGHGSGPRRDHLLERFRAVRGFTEKLCEPLETEDYVIQTMPDVSPAKWHLGHTSWFFERFILSEQVAGYEAFREPYYYLFNSYYNAVGPMHCRPSRGLLSRPTVAEVYAYRKHVDGRITTLLGEMDATRLERVSFAIELGLNHEQQHQELMVTDLKHVFSSNPLLPSYHKGASAQSLPTHPSSPEAMHWIGFAGGVKEIGCHCEPCASFCFDNETPRHKTYLNAFEIGSRPVTNGEYLRFIEDKGYERPELWLSLGWATVKQQGWKHPIYWWRDEESHQWMHYTLAGPRPVEPAEPVCHVSYFEADAFARWAGCRLPTEAEWEVASEGVEVAGHFADELVLHPRAIACDDTGRTPCQMFGDVWEWTSSAYSAYPGYRPWAGSIGEYNGKFMCNQFVLRGGSCATPAGHIRRTYRNFFPPEARWQFSGIRLARDAE